MTPFLLKAPKTPHLAQTENQSHQNDFNGSAQSGSLGPT